MTPVLTHDGTHWVAICDECGRPLARAPWWAPERLGKRAKHPHGGCAAVLLDDLAVYVAGRDTYGSAARRRGVTQSGFRKQVARVRTAYPEHATAIDDLIDALWRMDPTGELHTSTVAYFRDGVRSHRNRRRAAA
jgi:hypothetical protein